MAVLTEQDRFDTWRKYMKDNVDPFTVTKGVVRTDIDNADVWAQANKASFNSALSVEGQAAYTNQQKAMFLVYVLNKRFKLGI